MPAKKRNTPKKRFVIPKNKPLPRSKWGIGSCVIVSEEPLPNSPDILIRARAANQFECFVIWDPVRGILRSPWSHDDDRCEVMGWDKDVDTIAAVGNWTVKQQTLWARKREAVAAYSGSSHTPTNYASEENDEEE